MIRSYINDRASFVPLGTLKTSLLIILLLCKPSSPQYLPLDHWAYPYLELLQERGHLPHLDPLEKPYLIKQVIQNLEGIADTVLNKYDRDWVHLLIKEFNPFHLNSTQPFTVSSTENIHGKLLPEKTQLSGSLNLFLLMPTWSAANKAKFDQSWREDPNYPWNNERVVPARLEDSYVLTSLPALSLFAGRVHRIWGPQLDRSLVLSSNPHTLDQFYFSIKLNKITFSQIYAQLDAWPTQETARYFAAHRLTVHWKNWLNVGFFESIVLGGQGRFFDWLYLNPVNVYTASQLNGEGSGNSMLGTDFYFNPVKTVIAYGQLLLDDFQIDNEDSLDLEPAHYGWTFGIKWVDPLQLNWLQLNLEMTRASRWLYNVEFSPEKYLYHGRSLGLAEADLEHFKFSLSLFLIRYSILTLRYEMKRKGETDLTTPWPSLFGSRQESFPSGIIETNQRLEIGYQIRPLPLLGLNASLYYETFRNKDHLKSNSDSAPGGHLDLSLELDHYFYFSNSSP